MKMFAAGMTMFALAGCVPMSPIPGMPASMGGVGGTGMTSAEIQNASASLKAGQSAGIASAARPGDETMSCEAIQAELMVSMRDPKVQAALGSMTTRAQGQKDKIDSAMAGGKQVQPTAEDARAPLASAADLTSIMPQMMRGQRLNELASAKKCAFLKGAAPS